MAKNKKQVMTLTSGKKLKMNGNSFCVSDNLEVGEGFTNSIFGLVEVGDPGKTAPKVHNPHSLTKEDLFEICDYYSRLWLDLKDNLRAYKIDDPQIFKNLA